MQERIIGTMTNWASMSFSWTLLMLFRWLVCNSANGVDITSLIVIRVIVALMVSIVTFLIISFLDNIADSLGADELASDATEEALRHMIFALGILVGFSWEQVVLRNKFKV